MLINGLFIRKGGNMNDGNLIPQNKRTQRERKEISKKGAKKSNEVQKQKKQEEKQQKSLTEILKGVVYSEIKSPEIKIQMEKFGIKGDNYFTAMCAMATLKGIKKGDMNSVSKVFELLEKSSSSNENPEEEKSFQNLIGAIKDV